MPSCRLDCRVSWPEINLFHNLYGPLVLPSLILVDPLMEFVDPLIPTTFLILLLLIGSQRPA
jgi:hypothetical protein